MACSLLLYFYKTLLDRVNKDLVTVSVFGYPHPSTVDGSYHEYNNSHWVSKMHSFRWLCEQFPNNIVIVTSAEFVGVDWPCGAQTIV